MSFGIYLLLLTVSLLPLKDVQGAELTSVGRGDLVEWGFPALNKPGRPIRMTAFGGTTRPIFHLALWTERGTVRIVRPPRRILKQKRVKAVRKGGDVLLHLAVGNNGYQVYINHNIVFNFTSAHVAPGLISSVATFGLNAAAVKDELLQKLTPEIIASRLNHPQCGTRDEEVGFPPVQYCPKPSLGGRIVGGTFSPPVPWQVAFRQRSDRAVDFHQCGGILISECWVLTAAHCFKVLSQPAIEAKVVRVGDYFNRDADHVTDQKFSAFERARDLDIEAILPHPGFSSSYVNDVALVKLKQCATLGRFVRPVCLPTSLNYNQMGRECTITGWGASFYGQHNEDYPRCLMQGRVKMSLPGKCKQIFKKYSHRTMFCAIGENGVDGCQGDSGGPYVCQVGQTPTLVGITSSGWRCGVRDGIYTRVGAHMNWIYSTIMFNRTTSGLKPLASEKADQEMDKTESEVERSDNPDLSDY